MKLEVAAINKKEQVKKHNVITTYSLSLKGDDSKVKDSFSTVKITVTIESEDKTAIEKWCKMDAHESRRIELGYVDKTLSDYEDE